VQAPAGRARRARRLGAHMKHRRRPLSVAMPAATCTHTRTEGPLERTSDVLGLRSPTPEPAQLVCELSLLENKEVTVVRQSCASEA
jgi:hypothetical protein